MRVTWLEPAAITAPSRTTSAANGPPPNRTLSTAISMACLRNAGFIRDSMIQDRARRPFAARDGAVNGPRMALRIARLARKVQRVFHGIAEVPLRLHAAHPHIAVRAQAVGIGGPVVRVPGLQLIGHGIAIHAQN